MQDFLDDLVRRDERIRTQKINNKEYTIRCTDPYGHWHIEGKSLPAELQSSYTSAERAWLAIQAYEDAENLKKTIAAATVKSNKKEA